MAKYIYTAKSGSGETFGGEMVAADERILAQQLRADGFFVTSIKLIEEENKSVISIKMLDRLVGISLKEKMMFARNLGVMISSGLTIVKAISNLQVQTQNKRFQKVLQRIYDELQGGKTLSEGLALFPAIFDDLFVNMVRVGEAGGNLEEVLNIVAMQLEREHELKSRVRGAMIYPLVIMTAMVGVAFVMLTYILPKLMSVFEEMDVQLPASTQFVVGLSKFLRQNTILTLVSMAGLVFGIRLFLTTRQGKKFLSFISLHTPVLRNLIVKINCARFARIYSSLLRSGVSVIDALRIVSNTLTNTYYKSSIDIAIEGVQKGQELSSVIEGNSLIFPPLVSQMIEVGEQTGKTESIMEKLAEFYEEEIFQITKNMSSIIEPFLMIIIGLAVGFFAVSMLQPMYSLMENIQ